MLLCLLHLDNDDGVALVVPPSFRVNVDVVNLVVALDDVCSARTLPFEVHHLWCTPIKHVLGAYLLLLHLLRDVVVGNGTMVGVGVGIFQDRLQDLLGETDALDGMLPRDGLSVPGNGLMR